MNKSSKDDDIYISLSDREQKILRMMVYGYETEKIAALLGISLKTARNLRSNIPNKLNIHSPLDLVKYASKIGLVDWEGN